MKFSDFWLVGWKFTKFLMSYLKPHVSFSLTLHQSSMSWEITLLYLFSWNFIWFGQKEPIKVQNFTLLTAHLKFHKLYFDRLFLLKVYKISAKKVQRSYVSWHWKVIQNLKKNWLVVWKKTWGIWQIFTRALKILKNLHFDWFLLCKVYNVWPKIVQMIFHETEDWCKIWKKKKTFGLENDMRNLANFHQSTQKSQNWDFDGIL